jgi:hypothetical protein
MAFAVGEALRDAPVRPSRVVVRLVLGQDGAQVRFSHRIGRQIVTDLRKRESGCYLSSWRAMTMRWIWLVPS